MNFDRKKIKDLYRKELFDNVIPFWLKYSLDKEFGGFISQLDREGTPYGKDKSFKCKVELPGYFQTLQSY